MRAVLPIIASLAIAACSSGYPGPEEPTRAEPDRPAVRAATPAANFPVEIEAKADEPDPDDVLVLDFVRRDPHTEAHREALRRGDSVVIIPESPQAAGMGMSYNPELQKMGLKVGRDGNLHEIGPDARSPGDPDEGPSVGWEELHRKQFGHRFNFKLRHAKSQPKPAMPMAG